MISSLIASGVAKYGGYRLVKRVGVYDGQGSVRLVPSSKEAVFRDHTISLLDKRRLMRFLLFAAGDFEDNPELAGKEDTPFGEWLRTTWSLNDQLVDAISYALSYCTSSSGILFSFHLLDTLILNIS
jgi:Rab proteins geranylgeranyltransferase component A